VPTGHSYRPARTLLAICTAAVTAVVVLPGVGSADPAPTVEQVQARVDQLNHEAAVAAERYNDARLRLDDVQARLASAQERAGSQEARVAEARKNLSAFASATYRFGGVDPTVQFFTSANPEQFLASSASLSQLSTRQAASLRHVMAERATLAQDNALAGEQLADLTAAKADLERQKNEVEEKLGEAQHLLDRLQAADRARVLAAQRGSRDAGAERLPLEAYTGSASGSAAEAIAFAYAQLGDRYVYGAAGPNSWDCSGLTMGAWAAGGVSLPHSSRAQYSSGRKVTRSDLQPGDLVFFYSPISHVGLYIGNGQMIHASNPSKPVSIASIDSSGPYAGAVRP
jgi:cell wall-associated NlpC family hydrolase